MATHSSVLAWRIPWTEKPGRLLNQRVSHAADVLLGPGALRQTPVRPQRRRSQQPMGECGGGATASVVPCCQQTKPSSTIRGIFHPDQKYKASLHRQPTPELLPGTSRGRGAWRAAVRGAARSRARLSALAAAAGTVQTGSSKCNSVKLEMGYTKTANIKTYGMQLKMYLGKTNNLYHRCIRT